MIRRFAVTILFIVSLYFTPMSISAAENRPQLLYNNGNYTGALFYLGQTLKSKPNDPRILSSIGSVLLEAGNYSGAISFYKRALAFNPNHIGALAGIGYASESLGNRSAALMYFKKAIA
jgi:tetratricopeptide (TPR) repeat protein